MALSAAVTVPVSYDVVWSVVVAMILVGMLVALVMVVRALRRRSSGSRADRAVALIALRDTGTISEQEYEERKGRLLAEL